MFIIDEDYHVASMLIYKKGNQTAIEVCCKLLLLDYYVWDT